MFQLTGGAFGLVSSLDDLHLEAKGWSSLSQGIGRSL